MERQFTAGVYIIERQSVLLIFHRKLKKWLPPGGHLEKNETPDEAARREAREETGLEIAFISQEGIWVDRWNAKSFARPYLCLLEEVPAYEDQSAHQHIDFIYLARVAGGAEQCNFGEIDGMRWFGLQDINALTPDEEIFAETQDIVRSILQSHSELVPC